MNMIRIIFMSLFIAACFSCNRFVGKYGSPNSGNSFEFRKDSTFLNEYRIGHSVRYSSGVWHRLNKDTIVINSFIKKITVPLKFTIKDTPSINQAKITIDLKIDSGLDLSNYRCSLFINDKIAFDRSCDQLLSFVADFPMKKIYFDFYKEPRKPTVNIFQRLTSDTLHIGNIKKEEINITANFADVLFSYNPFNEVKIKTASGQIELYNGYSHQWQTFSKLPRKAHIFVHW